MHEKYKSTMSLQFSDLLVFSLAFSVVFATSSDVNKWMLNIYIYIEVKFNVLTY